MSNRKTAPARARANSRAVSGPSPSRRRVGEKGLRPVARRWRAPAAAGANLGVAPASEEGGHALEIARMRSRARFPPWAAGRRRGHRHHDEDGGSREEPRASPGPWLSHTVDTLVAGIVASVIVLCAAGRKPEASRTMSRGPRPRPGRRPLPSRPSRSDAHRNGRAGGRRDGSCGLVGDGKESSGETRT